VRKSYKETQQVNIGFKHVYGWCLWFVQHGYQNILVNIDYSVITVILWLRLLWA